MTEKLKRPAPLSAEDLAENPRALVQVPPPDVPQEAARPSNEPLDELAMLRAYKQQTEQEAIRRQTIKEMKENARKVALANQCQMLLLASVLEIILSVILVSAGCPLGYVGIFCGVLMAIIPILDGKEAITYQNKFPNSND